MSLPNRTSPVPQNRKYKAFISYSHAADDRLAPALQSGLQRFAKPWYRLRSIRVFRDKTGLAVTPELWGSIEPALQDSEFFLLLASPQAAESRWVAQETEWWLQHRSADQLLIILTDGEVAWDTSGSDFDWTRTSAISRTFQKRLKEEPNYLDLRWAKNRTDLSLRQPRFLEAIARLTATLRNRSLDELIGEDVGQHQKTMRLLRIGVGALVIVTLAALFAAFMAMQAQRIARVVAGEQQNVQTLQAQEILSSRLAADALKVWPTNHELGILLAAEAARVKPTPAAESALRQVLFQTRDPKWVLRGHTNSVYVARFSPDGKRVLTGSEDTTARIWDAATGKSLVELRGHAGPVNDGAFARDNRRVWTASEAGTVRSWNAEDGTMLYELPHPGVTQLEFDFAGSRLLTISDHEAVVWEAASGRKLAAFDLGVRTAAFPKGASLSPDGTRIALHDESVRAVDSGKVLIEEFSGHSFRPYTVRFSRDGQWIVTASQDQSARVWRTSDGKSLRVLPHDTSVADALVSPDGQWIVTRSDVVRIWDSATGNKVAEIAPPADPIMAGEKDYVFGLVFSDNGRCLITLSRDASSADIWETSTGEKVASLVGHKEPIRGASFSPDGKSVVTASLDGTANIYACESCGSLEDLLAFANKKAGRQLTGQERQSYQIPPAK